jgi:hypothetical protein
LKNHARSSSRDFVLPNARVLCRDKRRFRVKEALKNFFHKTVVLDHCETRKRSKSSESVKVIRFAGASSSSKNTTPPLTGVDSSPAIPPSALVGLLVCRPGGASAPAPRNSDADRTIAGHLRRHPMTLKRLRRPSRVDRRTLCPANR